MLTRFYGLGTEYTIGAIADFSRKLIVDEEMRKYCSSWLFRHSSPELLIRLLYDIGFVGIRGGKDKIVYKSSESPLASMPIVSDESVIVVHPTYADALSLQAKLVTGIGEDVRLRQSGIVLDLPESISLFDYTAKLQRLQRGLEKLPTGDESAAEFEELVGEIIKLCFFKALTNVQAKARDINGRVIRDWVAANHSSIGFWQMLRQQYAATQVIWECKNYKQLQASDFHQAAYYMNAVIGRVAFLVYRGGPEIKKAYLEHIRRIAQDKSGMVLTIGERDLEVFVRQSLNGKKSEGHLQDLFDRTVREIS